MAKKKTVKKDFDINKCYKKINPYIVDGLKRYIILNDIKIKSEEDFKKVYKKYGGL